MNDQFDVRSGSTRQDMDVAVIGPFGLRVCRRDEWRDGVLQVKECGLKICALPESELYTAALNPNKVFTLVERG